MDFVCVYIDEAHANDKWPLGTHVDIPSHKTFEDRVNASDILIKKYGLKIPVFYDTMTNEFDQQFAIWPERYYIIKDNKIDFVCEPTDEFGFDRNDIETNICNRLKQTEVNPKCL